MTQLTRFRLDDGSSVVVEVAGEEGFTRAGRTGRVVDAVGESFEQALQKVQHAASAALDQFRQMGRRPDEVKLKFGVKLDVEAGAVIAKTGVEGNLEVTLTWRATPPPSAS
ncbi:CU044_2847 family protein [Amycolatopsis cynarae]|uniref:CU044_2847 family protein n=1 Tax=Amycolatopsis cynarae TaxID=2995223 RepID=A0ABY7B725_9PSEU|nr:CU044_2847 family protein [Amycolatopsis sp. HUAS 11-8]WAL68115.1 CU044_2847 family protein [Amycolatopsis sp. HUAS 11-8]